MKDATGIGRVAGIVADFSHEPLVVVVSALGKTTNALENLLRFALTGETEQLRTAFEDLKQFHSNIVSALFSDDTQSPAAAVEKEFDKLWDALQTPYADRYEAYDRVVCFGEEFSGIILESYLKNTGIAVSLLSARCLIVTDSNHTDASVNWELTGKTILSRVLPALDEKKVVLTQGFIGSDLQGRPTTLGREGSDFTAAIFASVLGADELSIWKDVPGLMNCDPKRFEQAEKLPLISYHEAIELAFYGASVIHPKTIQPLQLKNIPLKVRPFHQPDSEPSLIADDTSRDSEKHKIIVKDKQVLLSIGSRNLSFIAEGNLTGIFEAFSKNKIHINLMQHSAVSFSVCFNHDADKLKALMADLKNDYLLKYNTGLQLLTIRHYNDELIESLTTGKKIYLEQKSRVTMQLLVKDS